PPPHAGQPTPGRAPARPQTAAEAAPADAGPPRAPEPPERPDTGAATTDRTPRTADHRTTPAAPGRTLAVAARGTRRTAPRSPRCPHAGGGGIPGGHRTPTRARHARPSSYGGSNDGPHAPPGGPPDNSSRAGENPGGRSPRNAAYSAPRHQRQPSPSRTQAAA